LDLTALGASCALALGWLQTLSRNSIEAAGKLVGLAPSVHVCNSTGLFLKLTVSRSLLDLVALGASFALALSRRYFEAVELTGLAPSLPV